MEEAMVEIPGTEAENGWQPPVVKAAPEAPPCPAADVFFMQYAVCILLLTAVLVLRVLDAGAFGNTMETFRDHTACPDEPWVTGLFWYIGSLWS